MEGMARPVFQIAKELSLNSRAGLTSRFLSKKLELPQEEVEYLVDVNHKLLYLDITKIKLPPEGINAVKRIIEGLENHGDVPALFQRVKNMPAQEFRHLEEHLGIDGPSTKKSAAETVIEKVYRHPDSVMEYVATHNFSATAREVFDIVWQSPEGLMPAAKVRAAHGGSESEVEQGLAELFRKLALFELFRFDAEERLIRVVALLTEVRQWRDVQNRNHRQKSSLKAQRGALGEVQIRGLNMTDRICQLVAALAAKPARLRGDGELFREDLRRLSDIVEEYEEPSLGTCLWAAEGVGWLGRVDNELRAGELEALIDVDHFERHRLLFDWLTSRGDEGVARRALADSLDDMRAGTWYNTLDFIDSAIQAREERDRHVLRAKGAHYAYLGAGTATNADKVIARALDETLFWLGVVEKCVDGSTTYFRVTDLGFTLLTGQTDKKVSDRYAKPGREIIVQPNFDIVVPTQDMDPLLTVPLDQFAVRQSSGSASVYLMTKESFTQALQDGHDVDAFISFLMRHNRAGALPANVMTTLDDWRGGLRRVRLRTIHVIEADDPLVMADLQHRRKFKKHLEPVEPQKVIGYTKIGRAELAKLLEKDGFIVE
jgi:hypothetical protein